ncbi:hypothetical protein GCM10011382_06850 [Vreelandella lutescens]|uniref:Uncharacterized protein n=1 Tax=Vreelandella lutescens TaxID=1602943 RepID=A0ABQ1NKV3_9GAMM|nr:hypothetical protein GCM10011382_06850 [Halomonas lutescens]
MSLFPALCISVKFLYHIVMIGDVKVGDLFPKDGGTDFRLVGLFGKSDVKLLVIVLFPYRWSVTRIGASSKVGTFPARLVA